MEISDSRKLIFRRWRAAICAGLLLWASLAFLRHVLIMEGWRDHGIFYYAPRLFLTGQDAYSWDLMKRIWREDGRPLGIDPGTTMSGFVTPPSMALLYLPASLAPPRFGYRAIDCLNLFALATLLLSLMQIVSKRWSLEARLLFSAYVLTLPAVSAVIVLGQSTLLIAACISLGLLSLSKQTKGALESGKFVLQDEAPAAEIVGSADVKIKRESAGRLKRLIGGAFIGLALSKFTLALPLLGVAFLLRKWRIASAAILTFAFVNLALSAPFGVLKTTESFLASVTRENRPGSSYDAISRNATWMPHTLIHAKRMLFLIVGGNRSLVEGLNAGVTLFVIATLVIAFGSRRNRESGEEMPPLAIASALATGLLIFYHRNYDLAVVPLITWALLMHGGENAGDRTIIWHIAVAISLLLSCTPYFAFQSFLTKVGGPDAPCLWTSVLVFALFLGTIGVSLRSRLRLGTR